MTWPQMTWPARSPAPQIQPGNRNGDANMTAHQTRDIEEDTRGVSRRLFITASAAAGLALSQGPARAAIVRTDLASLPPYGNGTLPAGIRARPGPHGHGLTGHILDAGVEQSRPPTAPLRPRL